MYIRSYLQNNRMTVALTGEIDHHEAQRAMKIIADKIDAYAPHRCTLDFRDVAFMDSSGIAIVIMCVRRMRELGGKLILCNIQPQPMRVFEAAGIQQIAELQGGAQYE